MSGHAPQHALKGVLLAVAGTLAFALTDVLTKRLVSAYGVPFVSLVRYAINVVLLILMFYPTERGGLVRVNRMGLVVLRGVVLAAATITMGLALQRMPVGETVAIAYLAPLLVLLLSGPILGEKVPLAAWIGAGIGFAGVLLIMRPGSGLAAMGVVLALINAGVASGYHLMSRVLTRTETTIALLFWTALVGTAVFAVIVPFYLPGQWPGGVDSLLLLLLAALATLGHYLFTASYRFAPAALIAPVGYMHLVFSAGLGWLVFGHLPLPLTLVGMALVLAAGVWIALRAGRQK